METEPKKRTRTFTWSDPAAWMEASRGKPGLQQLRDGIRDRLGRPPFLEILDIRLVSIDEGRAVFEGQAEEYFYNPIGVVHGGYAMTMVDSATGVAVHTTLAVDERYTSLETKVNFVRPITLETGRMRCEGVVVYRGSKIATAEAKLIAIDSGKLLAHGTSTCLIIPARSA